MDTTELHYLTYDPDAIFTEMQEAYTAEGGDVLYPGDEKTMLLRAVQSVMVQAFAGVDSALRMSTLRYAVGDYLDLYGEKRECPRIAAAAASAVVKIVFSATGTASVLNAGMALTADGERMYLTREDVIVTGYAQTVLVNIDAKEAGSAGNGLLTGTQMQFMIPQANVISVYCTQDAAGGQEKEEDETYRARIRKHGLSNVTTGPKDQYESAAMSVTSEILDARASNLGAGQVGVALLLKNTTGSAAIIQSVKDALNDTSARPLTDVVSIYLATDVAYTLNVQYKLESAASLTKSLADVVAEYQEWQDSVIGRAFNPDRLMAMIYQAGAVRVVWGTGSTFNGGSVAYTEISATERCKGTITLSAITE